MIKIVKLDREEFLADSDPVGMGAPEDMRVFLKDGFAVRTAVFFCLVVSVRIVARREPSVRVFH